MSSVHQPDINGPVVYRCAQAGCRECLERWLAYHRRLVYLAVSEQYLNGLLVEDAARVGMVGCGRRSAASIQIVECRLRATPA